MDKNKIKSFAIWARRNLISAVSEKAYSIGITENKIEEAIPVQGGFKLEGKEDIFPLSNKHRNALVYQVKQKSFEQVMEEVAYTWFNRFMGLRYMEVNDYLPTGIRVLSSEVEGKVEPDVLTRVSEVIEDLGLNADEIYELIDSGKTEDREKAYKTILVKQCNELGKIIPQMFEKISDYTELLLPDNLLEEGSVIRKMVSDIEEEDWKEEVEIIGWMYQYYISEKKDEVFAALKKNVKITKENIPAATQLFTPKWIVKYMVENSLGRLWLEGHPNEELQKEWKYYLEEAEQEPEVEIELQKIREEHAKLRPEDIKVLDPCMGSGHILVYAFDVLYEIYKTAGYSEREIPKLILKNNLYGLDIDDRAAQLASFALIMKARHYNRRLFREIEREHLYLNLCSIQESNPIEQEAIEYFCSLKTGLDNEELKKDLEYLVTTFKDAKEYGSILEVKEVNFEVLKQRLKEIENDENLIFGDYRKMLLDKMPTITKQAEIMSFKYEVCVTNPPYMGRRGMNTRLNKYISENFISPEDFFTVFIEKGFKFSVKNGFNTMITTVSWMFLSSYLKLREFLIEEVQLEVLLHMDVNQMISFSTVAAIFRNSKIKYRSRFDYIRDKDIDYNFNIPTQFPIYNKRNSICDLRSFSDFPNKIFAYWCSESLSKAFRGDINIGNRYRLDSGIKTGNNDEFLRLWFEVVDGNICEFANEYSYIENNEYKWYRYNKGGGNKKWYGSSEHVINLKNNAEDIKNKISKDTYRLRNPRNYFKNNITWPLIGNDKFSCKFSTKNILNDVTANAIYFEDKIDNYIIALLNSKPANSIINLINPTVSYPIDTIKNIPLIPNKDYDFGSLATSNIDLAKMDWDSFETSWDFEIHPLLKLMDKSEQYQISSIFTVWETECEKAFNKLKYNEEKLNRIFIDIYGFQDELTPDVDDNDITIRKADRERDIKSFISYAVGCMLGRYSIDVKGLIYAGGEFNEKWDLDNKKVRKIEKDEDGNIISDSWVDATFMPDRDNIIPITEDEYFEDDIVARFIDFVRTVYSDETLEENLEFIADSIGRKAYETARQAIRRYFIKDFYKNHLKVYQKRPIYWMFDSGKCDGFKALIYMHRYNEQTVAKVRTDYLHKLQRKYESAMQIQQLIQDSDSTSAKDRVIAKKRMDRISKQIEECREYDQIVAHLANEKITIDLDDGVKVNYAKFQGVKILNSKDQEVRMNLLSKI